MQTAKLFWSGRSQAVRLPKEFRFQGDKVQITERTDTRIVFLIEKTNGPIGKT